MFETMDESGGTGDAASAIVIGPDATTTTGVTPAVLSLRQGLFVPNLSLTPPPSYYDIRFDQNANGRTCKCAVTLAPDMLDLYALSSSAGPAGTPSTNIAANVVGPTGYAAPIFANAATVGVPLTLNPNELGIGVSTDTIAGPGKGGLKLRVECSTQYPGTAELVALAGKSTTPTKLADDIGGGLCNQ